ncbi:MAG: UDP-N-acetylmuramate dehydrogenase [Paludibacteraceae bacterium]|nr:UDP-N-acetylmuramate dehydrogenase [Paludibacteraceae bacterium]
MTILENESVKRHTTFGVEAKAQTFIEYSSVSELKSIISSGKLKDRRFMCIGGGSNLLFCRDYDGVLLHSCIMGIDKIAFSDKEVLLSVGAGVVWDDFVSYCVEAGYYGAENLSIIPGEVGASPVQNIGAYGVEAKDIIESVECVDLETGVGRVFTNAECCFGYRDSIFKRADYRRYAVVRVTYRLSLVPRFSLDYGNIKSKLEGVEVNLKNVREAVIAIRESKLPDPKVTGNAGSFFKNPVVAQSKADELLKDYPEMPHFAVDGGVKIPAAWLIEQSGWKGRQLGNAAVDARQPLVLVNYTGKASADEVVALSDTVAADVKAKFGIDIFPEVIFVK